MPPQHGMRNAEHDSAAVKKKHGGPRDTRPAAYDYFLRPCNYRMNSISRYFGSGQYSSLTTASSLSATRRSSSIAGNTLSRM